MVDCMTDRVQPNAVESLRRQIKFNKYNDEAFTQLLAKQEFINLLSNSVLAPNEDLASLLRKCQPVNFDGSPEWVL